MLLRIAWKRFSILHSSSYSAASKHFLFSCWISVCIVWKDVTFCFSSTWSMCSSFTFASATGASSAEAACGDSFDGLCADASGGSSSFPGSLDFPGSADVLLSAWPSCPAAAGCLAVLMESTEAHTAATFRGSTTTLSCFFSRSPSRPQFWLPHACTSPFSNCATVCEGPDPRTSTGPGKSCMWSGYRSALSIAVAPSCPLFTPQA
mmetsp:Transcript_112463/g.318599  ORF Transcript_112463/g.318599 Transcript_112463/m.318599 type:complete len:206 (-) Transcript_112463:72-689(-)